MITIHPVTTPPITESITGGKRHTTSKKSVVFQCSFIIMSISHKIPVLSPLGMFTSLHPIPVIRITIEKKIVGVIYASPSVLLQEAHLPNPLCAPNTYPHPIRRVYESCLSNYTVASYLASKRKQVSNPFIEEI